MPLVQSTEDEPDYITTRLSSFEGDCGISFIDKWENVLKVDSFTNAGKMKWAQACNLEKECQALMDSFNSLDIHGDDKLQNGKVLTTYKSRMFYNLPRQHRQPLFQFENAECKHH